VQKVGRVMDVRLPIYKTSDRIVKSVFLMLWRSHAQ
jgi:hypothetical protein